MKTKFLFMTIAILIISIDSKAFTKQDTITIVIKGELVKDSLIFYTILPKSLDKGKVYNFRVEIKSHYQNADITINPKFTTKETNIPDILKAYFQSNTGIISPVIPVFKGQVNANEDNTIYTAKSEYNNLKINGDFTTIEITFRKNSTKDNSPSITKVIELGNQNYIKCFSYTTGIFYNTLLNNTYIVSSDGTKIIKENTPKFDISIGALANFNYVIHPDFKAGVGIGAALSPMDIKLRFLIGPTFTLGRKDELAISCGLAFAQLTALSGSISTNGVDYNLPLSNTSTTTTTNIQNTSATGVVTNTQMITNTSTTNIFKSVPTYAKWERGFFIGISWSLMKK